jgi:hypothetical protein
MRERQERVRIDIRLMLRKLLLTRFTVKIRTPSFAAKITPRWFPWGKFDYMGAMPLDASFAHRPSFIGDFVVAIPSRQRVQSCNQTA